jgi:hypothetical protein
LVEKLVLLIDGLDSYLVDCYAKNLRQKIWGEIDVPISDLGFIKCPNSPSVWASFLTGEWITDLYFEMKGWRSYLLKSIMFLRRFIPFGFNLGKKIRGRRILQFPRLDRKTFFDLIDGEAVNVPFINYDYTEFNYMQKYLDGEYNASTLISKFFIQQSVWKSKVFNSLGSSASLVCIYSPFLDQFQHFSCEKSLLSQTYGFLNRLINDLQLKFTGHIIIISDHGIDLKSKNHSMKGFFSSNLEMTKPKKITDFYSYFVEEVLTEKYSGD